MTSFLKKNLIYFLGTIILLAFYIRFEPFFPNQNGKLGHDYSLFLPYLLDGTYWYQTNGLFEVPWFTPSFGGGLPKFPNPQAIYYSVPQFMSFFINPLASVKVTILLFGIFGFIGFYIFLKDIFQLNKFVALLGATLFLFNGFYLTRMIVGHLTFHSFMLFPILAYFTLAHLKNNKANKLSHFLKQVLIGSLILAYMIYSGAFHLIPIILLGLIIFYIIHNLRFGSSSLYSFALRFFLIIIIGSSISAAKLNASISFITIFERDFYSLSGFNDIGGLIWICLKSLFYQVPFELACKINTNNIFLLEIHEYEIGITIIPFIIILLRAMNIKRVSILKTKYDRAKLINIFILIFLLSIPLALNYYSPSWNEFLKRIPFIRSSVTLIRWFAVYIPVFILIASIFFDEIKWVKKHKSQIAASTIFLVIILNYHIIDNKHYHRQNYNPESILKNYSELKSGEFIPKIKYVGSRFKINNKTYEDNNVLVLGVSQLYPYEPIFGYRLEKYPKKNLQEGSIYSMLPNGYLNIKNPVSYVFPEENNLTPGSHFKITEIESVNKFSKYKSYPFKISKQQMYTNYITIISLIIISLVLVYLVLSKTLSRFLHIKK